MMNPWLIITLGVLWLACLVGVGKWQNEAGHVAERTAWQAKDNEQLRLANAEILRLETEARTTEAGHQKRLVDIANNIVKDKRNDALQHQADLDRVRNGSLILRDPGATGLKVCAGAAGALGAGPGGGDGAGGAQLSGAAAEFLLTEASRADDIARQLAAAQAVIVEDRRVCGYLSSGATPDAREGG